MGKGASHMHAQRIEERIQKGKTHTGVQFLETAVAMQGTGRWAEGRCSCGGQWVFQGYRERQVTTSQGVIRLQRAQFTCERCGQGWFPLGRGKGDCGGLECRGARAGAVDSPGDAFISGSRGGLGALRGAIGAAEHDSSVGGAVWRANGGAATGRGGTVMEAGGVGGSDS